MNKIKKEKRQKELQGNKKKETKSEAKNYAGTLFIDSTDSQKVLLAFAALDESKEILANEFLLQKGSSQTAEFLKKFLKTAVKNDFNKISAIAVATGKGSFAGIRAGLALALGMGFAKDIPVYALTAGGKHTLITEKSEIDYGAAPNIGIAKKKILKQIK
jgi:hypothetical protein